MRTGELWQPHSGHENNIRYLRKQNLIEQNNQKPAPDFVQVYKIGGRLNLEYQKEKMYCKIIKNIKLEKKYKDEETFQKTGTHCRLGPSQAVFKAGLL